MRSHLPNRMFVRDTVLFLFALVFLLSAFHAAQPSFSNGRYRFVPQKEWTSFTHPFSMNTEDDVEVEILSTMRVGLIRPSRYRIVPDDCIQSITVNRLELPAEFFPLCGYVYGKDLKFSPYLRAGENTLLVALQNDGGLSKLQISVAPNDPLLFLLRFLVVLLIFVYFWKVALRYCKKRFDVLLWLIFAFATFMRLYYFFGTPYGIRGHDTDGHVEYIQYLLDHSFAMPSSGTGWEFYHPPLYYALSAVWMQIHSLFEPLKAALLRGLQVEALLLSIGTYGVICWISSLLFPKRKHRKDRLMFLLVLAVQPSLLYFSARVNNDVLYQLFAFVAFGFLLRWWRDERPRDWYVAIVATGLGILTKSNALLLLPVLYGCLLIRKKMSWDKKLKLGIRGILAILCMCAWFYVVRFGWENNTSLIENTRNLHSGLRVENSIDTLTEFNPLRLILEPYNNAWGGEVRNHFWEYWFLSSLFGEFSFGPVLRPLASALVALALFLLPVLFIGFYRIIRHAWYKTFPLWYSVLVLLAGHIAIRQYEPFSPTQDFRFAVLLLVPAVYSLLIGIRLLPKKRRPLFRGALLLLVALCSLFIVSIPFVRV